MNRGLSIAKMYLNPYQIVNWVAVAGHLIASITFLVLYLNRTNLEIGYTESYLKWVRINGEVYNGVLMNSTDACEELKPPGRNLSTANNGDFCIVPTTAGGIGGLDLGWLIISFHLLSFFFQALAGVTDFFPIEIGGFRFKYSDMIRDEGKNPLRFIEYSISASIMLICIAFLNGVTDINLIAAIAVLTACCQLCGLVVEYMSDDQLFFQWGLHFVGWIQFLCAYGIISHAFFKSINADEDIKPPDFVYVIVFLLFALYACFGAVQLVELCQKTDQFLCCKSFFGLKCCGCRCECCNTCECCKVRCKKKEDGRCDNQCKELSYVILSLGAKLTLGMLIFSNVLFSTREE
jgi:hypothetical protein